MKIDTEAFEEWKAHPITEHFLRACASWAEEAKAHWLAASWDGEKADPILLARMRERATTLEQMRSLTVEQLQ